MKKFITLFIISMIAIVVFTGCSNKKEVEVAQVNEYEIIGVTHDGELLVYNVDTRLVYIDYPSKFRVKEFISFDSPNGNPYKYIDGKLVEVID